MHKKFDHTAIEQKWQSDWNSKNIYETNETNDKPKVYVLDMFLYPSGEGLHVGHPKGFIATDIYARYKRMSGYNVLHPMGWDAFGLPAENYAIKNKVHPRVAVEKNVANFKSQLAKLGVDYDWGREINTTDSDYYKWTQWIFVQLFKKGLAYQSHEPINWCPGCQTGLANEDLESDGTCERCGSAVEKKPMRQWVLKIRDYADRMLADLDSLAWPDHIKEAQRNWIGRSEGAEIDFALSTGDSVTVFTTRPDTLYGATYMVLAPEHALVQKAKRSISNWKEVSAYIDSAQNKKEMDRLDTTKEKTGVYLEGITATNPATNEEIPVYIADYVLASYGTGAIMAVPAHDERDFAFAKKYIIPIRSVIAEKPITHVGALLRVAGKSDTYIFQKRTHDTDILPGKIAFFGGKINEDDTCISDTLKRELDEELELSINKEDVVESYSFASETDEKHQVWIGLIKDIHPDTLVCHEGSIVEMTLEEALSHPDMALARTTRQFIIDHFTEPKVKTEQGILIDSGEHTRLTSEEAKSAITKAVQGTPTKTYKIKDWVFSRQRYWGEPIPIVHTDDGTAYPVTESQLPVTLPEVEHYEPSGDGQSPLASITDWVNVTGYVDSNGDFVVSSDAPDGATLIAGKRETNTMPQWAGSSWYYLRFMDPKNDSALVNPEKERYWAPVDVYVGGDHAVRHLIYARFWHKFLYDINVVSTIEPFQRLEFLGFILAEDGRKMSKRWGNIINPDDIVSLVGADTLRVYEMFMGPFENTIAWSQDGLVGARRFLERVHGLSEHISDTEEGATTRLLHKTINKVRDDIEKFKFNTAISAMMIFINDAEKNGLSAQSYSAFLSILAPFAPHLTEELWAHIGNTSSIHLAQFPEANSSLLQDELVTIGVQVNGKVRGEITISKSASEKESMECAQLQQGVIHHLENSTITKIIYVPGRILNILTKSPE